jgi:hypothetical protein
VKSKKPIVNGKSISILGALVGRIGNEVMLLSLQ